MSRQSPTRRRFLKLSGAALTLGVAGCGSQSGSPSATRGTTSDSTTQGTNTAATTAETTATNTATQTTTTERQQLHTDYNSRERFRRPGGLVDDFEDLGRWHETGTGTLSAGTERSFVGSQSAHLRGKNGNHALVERSIPPTDMSDVDLSVALYTSDPRKIAFFVRLVDMSGNAAVLELRSITYRPPDLGWFRTAPGVFKADPGMDFSNVGWIQLQVNNATGKTVDAWVDDLRAHPKPDKGYVVLSWDDGTSDYYEEAAPVQDRYGFPGTVTMTPQLDVMGKSGFMSKHEFVQRDKAGDDVVSHGSIKSTWEAISPSKLKKALTRHKRWLLRNKFEGAKFVVYPGNRFDQTTLNVTSGYHYMGGMNQSGSLNTTGVYGFDPLVLPRTIGHDLGISKRVVDVVAKHRNCGLLNFHRFGSRNTMSKSKYEKLLEHIDSKGDAVEVITFTDLWEMRKENHDATPDIDLTTGGNTTTSNSG